MASTFTSVDDYVASFPPEVRPVLEQLRDAIARSAPTTTASISYGIPTYKLDGKYLVYFAGWKRHVGIYPVVDVGPDLEAEIAPYRAAKGTLRFPLEQPFPFALVERVVAELVRQRVATAR